MNLSALQICHAREGGHTARVAQSKNWIPAFAGMTMLLAAMPAFAADLIQEPTRSVTASGIAERRVAPDEAHVTVNINATNLKLETAKAEHDRKLTQVMAITKKSGIEDAQMKTQNSTIKPQYTYEGNKRNFKGYRVNTMLDITVKNIDSIGDLIDKLTTAGLENGADTEWGDLISTSYTIADPDKIRDNMLVDAIKNARSKADSMAQAAGGSLGSVIQITEGNAPQFNFPRAMPMMAMAAGGTVAKTSIAPPVGEQEVNANVTVIFELK